MVLAAAKDCSQRLELPLAQGQEKGRDVMRRALLGIAVIPLSLLTVAAPAAAATGKVTHFRFHGTFAEAAWSRSSATRFTETSVLVTKTKNGSELFVDVFRGKLRNGEFAGGTDTTLRGTGRAPFLTSGFSFAINTPKLTSASLKGSALPARTCTIDATGNQTGCKRTTIGVNVRWTGHGPITRTVSNFHMKTAGFSLSSHSTGTSRGAAATGTVAGLSLTSRQLAFADLGTTKSGEIKRCIGC